MVSREEVLSFLKANSWPLEYNEKLRTGSLESNVAVTSLWTFKNDLVKVLDKKDFSVIGNLYDKENGLMPLIRNLLSNPLIRYLFVLGNDMSGSKQALIDFFEKGVSESHCVVGSNVKLEKEVPLSELNKVRENVKLIDLTGKITTADLNDELKVSSVLNESIKGLEVLLPYDLPKIFPKPVLSTESFPSHSIGVVVKGDYVGETWLKILEQINRFGKITKMKTKDSFKIKEIINLVAVIDKEDADKPRMEPYFNFDESYLKSYYDEICTDKIPEGVLYTYGSRLRAYDVDVEKPIDQIQDLIDYLKVDTYRKSALAMTWVIKESLTRRYLNKDKNNPCIILVQPNIQDGVLHLTTYIRSNDMFRAWPLNAFALRKLQKILAEGLSVDLGSLTTISCSAHFHDFNFDKVERILSDNPTTNVNCFDSKGYFTIKLNDNKIVVEHFANEGGKLGEYSADNALELTKTLLLHNAVDDSYHCLYLGRELQKAEIALKTGKEFMQDQSLEV
ncbi:MAG: thymidylate synthase [archaeon]